MKAFLFTLALFLYWAVVGLAVITFFPPRLRILQGILVSPAVGVATVIVPVFLLSRAGLPVKTFADVLFPTLGYLAFVVLFLRKPVIPWKYLLWFGLILVGALLLAGRPLLSYGFDWVSVANDDMANYCLAAQRFLNHGYFDLPNVSDLLAGRDYSQAYWFMHVAAAVRAGSELMLAAVWGFTGLNAYQAFMPVIMALHLALICGGSALAAGPIRSVKAPLITAGLITISPLTTFGALSQLIGQVGGLALLCAAVVLFYRKISIRPVARLLKANVAGAVVFGALFVWYPEVLPFLGLGWFAYLVLKFRQESNVFLRIIVPALVIGGLALTVMGPFVLSSLQFMLKQASIGTDVNQFSVLFPYFLVPSGLPTLLGLISIGSEVHEPILSVFIAVAIVLIVWILKLLIVHIKQAIPFALVLAVMICAWIFLFFTNNAFGLFKLSMFIQPFLLAMIGFFLARLLGELNKKIVFFILIILATNVVSEQSYVNKSIGDFLNKDFLFLSADTREDTRKFVSDAESVALAKFQALYMYNEEAIFLSRDFFGLLIRDDNQFGKNYHLGFDKNVFQFNDNDNQFSIRSRLKVGNDNFRLITTNHHQSIFNSYEIAENNVGYFKIVDKPVNRLVFVHSELGNHYYLGNYFKGIAYYPLEDDPMAHGRVLSGLGRYQLFMVLGATEAPRMVVELTATVMKQFASTLPQPTVQGENLVTVPFVGRGSGRVFSAPIIPQTIGGLHYLGLDMGRDAQQFPNHLTGLMLLYGREVHLDPRRLAAFGRDISLVSEAEYQAIKPPYVLSNFPADLANRGLEYSGIYEDGWISERSFFILAPKPDSRYLVIRGMVPQIDTPDFRNTLEVSIDGKEIIRQTLGLGVFEVKVPVLNDLRHRIDLAFDRYQVLPGTDGRPIGGKIEFIGFVSEGIAQ